MSLWTDLRDTAESAVVIAGNYVLPGSSLITSRLVSDGSQEQLNSNLGTLAQLGSAGAGAWNGNLANYQTAANSILGSVSPGTTVESISQATGLSGTQLARLGITAASLLAGGSAIANATGGTAGGTGGLGLTQQDRSGFSSGSANYSPEYYAAIQSKYNQYMPQQQGKDITTDLKNWYETKYTPQATIAGTPTLTTTGTGYSTPTTLTNLGTTRQAVTPTLLPSVAALTPTSSAADIAKAYSDWSSANGGNTAANRSASVTYLRNLGIPDSVIQGGYNTYLSTLPTATGTTAQTLAANSTPSQIAQAYASWVGTAGGDTQANREHALTYLRSLGIPDATIQASLPVYLSSITPQSNSTGMLTGNTQVTPTAQTQSSLSTAGAPPASVVTQAQEQPSYTSLTSSSSPAAIAAAYRDFVAGSGGDIATNREAAINYLNNLGVSNDTIGQAYGLFKG